MRAQIASRLAPERIEATSSGAIIVFTDIERSTELAERLGDERWLGVMLEHNRLMRACVARSDGRVVKSTGDGFLLMFGDVQRAVACAVEIQRALAVIAETHPYLRVRIGIHAGDVFQEEGDLLGLAVWVANRVTGVADGGEIVISAAARRLLGTATEVGRPRQVLLRGLSHPQVIHLLNWRRPNLAPLTTGRAIALARASPAAA